VLAAALKVLKRLQDKHHGVVESKDIAQEHRALLLDTGFLRPVMKGWYICANPADMPGDSTLWYASFWAFVSGYLTKRFGKRYCLNPETSLLLHTGNTTIPRQVTVVTKDGGTTVVGLPFDTSLLLYPKEKRIPKSRTEVRGLQVWPIAEALCLCGPQFFKNNPREAEIALQMVRDPAELLTYLLSNNGMLSSASRLAGALNFVGREEDAARIVKAMSRPGSLLTPQTPFDLALPTLAPTRERSPHVLRLQSMWAGWRQTVIDNFPAAPGLPESPVNFIAQVDERYVSDAYNSLSIEGYQVTDQLIERVARGDWNPEEEGANKKDQDALAARGYYQAFGAVKKTLVSILQGKNAGKAVQSDHHDWYVELFGPAVTAGILTRHQLAGYRTGPIYIRNSMHTPMPREAILDSIEALFALIENEPQASVRAVIGHHLFVFIHPYFDGNGRMGRFLMNALLASGGYPWTVVRVKCRQAYMQALEDASVRGNILPLTLFLRAELEQASLSTTSGSPP
jgi:fido (protein-threonine AMPylation protein)